MSTLDNYGSAIHNIDCTSSGLLKIRLPHQDQWMPVTESAAKAVADDMATSGSWAATFDQSKYVVLQCLNVGRAKRQVCMCIALYLSMCIYVYLYLFIFYLCVYIYTHMCRHMCLLCMHAVMCKCMHTFHIYNCIFRVYVYEHVYVDVFVYRCICTHVRV